MANQYEVCVTLTEECLDPKFQDRFEGLVLRTNDTFIWTELGIRITTDYPSELVTNIMGADIYYGTIIITNTRLP